MSDTTTNSLKEQSQRLLDPQLSMDEMKAIIDEIHVAFTSFTGLSGEEMDVGRTAAIQTAYGKALGMNYAALCLVDYKRTVAFLRGLVAAIREKQQEFPGEQIKVFYAGCGPYAPFVTLVAPLFEPSELCFSILDINPESLNTAQHLIQQLGMEEYVEKVILDDAVTCEIPDAQQYHVLFSETLDAVLSRECYVPILCNMIPQFREGTAIVPENVQLTVTFAKRGPDGNPIEGTPTLIFDARKAARSTFETRMIPESFPPERVPIERNTGIYAIVLDTIVHVFGEFQLVRDESQLTKPFAFSIDPNVPFNTLVFTYNLKPEIGLFSGTEMAQ